MTHMARALLQHNSCFSLSMVYTNAMLVLHWSWLIPTHCLFSSSHFVYFIYGRMYVSTTSTRCIAGPGNILHSQNYGHHIWLLDISKIYLWDRNIYLRSLKPFFLFNMNKKLSSIKITSLMPITIWPLPFQNIIRLMCEITVLSTTKKHSRNNLYLKYFLSEKK